MASLRASFLAVYASNGIIKLLFLPTCYTILFSPFTLTVAIYLGLDQTIRKLLPQDFSALDLLPPIVLSAVLLALPTRLLSTYSSNGTKRKDERRTRRVQSLPYWIPGFKNFWSIIFGGERWLKDVRDSSINGIASYHTAGAKHNIVFLDALLEQVYKNQSNFQEPRLCKQALIQNAFGVSKSAGNQYFELSSSIAKLIETEVFKGGQMQGLIESTLNILSESLPDFITFNSSIVDQMQWERVSGIELTDGTSEAECDLFTLINEFCCNAILPPIMGAQFTESYQLLATDLAAFNQRFWALALGLPRFSPVQGLPAAALARKRLTHNFKNFLRDLTNPPVKRVPDDDESVSGGEETDADSFTPLTKLNALFTEHNLSMELRASIALQLVHGIISEVVPLVFWTLLHIFSTTPQDGQTTSDSPLQKIRLETKTWALAVQPPSIHPSFPAPPEIKFKSVFGALSLESYTYLQSCINESRRLYYSSNTIYEVTKPTILEAKSIGSASGEEKWELETGSYIDIGLSRSLINSSSTSHVSPRVFQLDRFTSASAPSSITSSNQPSTPYVNALLVSLVTGIIQLWEISAAPKKTFFDHLQEVREEATINAAPLSPEEKAAKEKAEKEKRANQMKKSKWIIPKAIDGAEIKIPQKEIRVRIRRLEGLPKTDVIRRIG